MNRLILFCLSLLLFSCGEKEGSGGRTIYPDAFAFRDDSRLVLSIDVVQPLDIAVGEGDLILCVGGREARLLDRDGKAIRSWFCPFKVRAVTAGTGNTFWIAGVNQVGQWSSEGEELARWPVPSPDDGQPVLITGLARVGASLFFADAGNCCVHRYAVDGDFINLIGDDFGPLGLVIPSPYFSVCAAADGSLWLTHTGQHKVSRWSLSGTRQEGWGKRGMGPGEFGGCCNPVGLALFANDKVVTAEKGLGRVSIYTAKGKLVSLIGSRLISRKARGLKVVVDSKDRILVLDPFAKKILVFVTGQQKEDGNGGR